MRLAVLILAAAFPFSAAFAAWAVWRSVGRRLVLDGEREARATANRRGKRLAVLLAVNGGMK